MSNEVINLRKGDKVNTGFTNITVGLGWKSNEGTGRTLGLYKQRIQMKSIIRECIIKVEN